MPPLATVPKMSSLEGNPVQSHPFIYWAQSRTHVWLKVDLKDVKVNIV